MLALYYPLIKPLNPQISVAAQYFTVTIPVKSYVRKYIQSRYPNPMVLSLTNYLGTVIYSYLDKHKTPNLVRGGAARTEIRYRLLTDHIKVLIPRSQVHKHLIGFSIPHIKAVLINNLFEEKISEDLHTYCVVYEKAGLPRRKAIEDFCDDNNIEIDLDITYQAFKKAEYRHRKTLKKSTAHLSPPLFGP